MSSALITGGSAGLGRALAAGLADNGWDVIVTARHRRPLIESVGRDTGQGSLTAVDGDVTDPAHRAELARLVSDGPRLDLLVNNASTLGQSPLPAVLDLTADVLDQLWQTNVAGPIALIQTLRPYLADDAAVINISSDAAVEHYETWGGYAATKAALDHLTATLAAEDPKLRWYAVDPGDMRTQMHQDAFPGEDISDRPEPESVVPGFLQLLEARPPSGRYRAVEFVASPSAAAS
jgi:NAD(P)-dependent dehydrogenase (short-subunit alcohol dehydrogenase family)